MPPHRLTIPTPMDAHLHLRDGAMLRAVVGASARNFGRAVIMPNLKPPVTTSEAAAAYRARIQAALPEGTVFEPLMTLYLTDTTDPADVARGVEEGILTAAKLYPAGATTNSQSGVTDMARLAPTLAVMEKRGLPLLLHGEVTDPATDIFDREAVFIERVLIPLRSAFPGLKIVLEHVTTAEGVSYVAEVGATSPLAGTITAHHLRLNRNALFDGGLRPHAYCLPLAKRERHRLALVKAATSGLPMFFLGTDSAPHPRAAKEADCGCAGIFTAMNALEIYASVFDEANALGQFAAFASLNAPRFYGLAAPQGFVTLEKQETPAENLKPILTDEGAEIMPFHDSGALLWRAARTL